MKSIKFVIIASLFLAASARASHNGSSDWAELRMVKDIDPIPVYVESPRLAWVLNMNELEIQLKEIGARTYEGCTDFELMAAIDVLLGCNVVSNRRVRGDFSCSINDKFVHATHAGPAKRTVCVRLENARFRWPPAAAKNVQVATLALTVSCP